MASPLFVSLNTSLTLSVVVVVVSVFVVLLPTKFSFSTSRAAFTFARPVAAADGGSGPAVSGAAKFFGLSAFGASTAAPKHELVHQRITMHNRLLHNCIIKRRNNRRNVERNLRGLVEANLRLGRLNLGSIVFFG
jgi:hypothetical protein